MGPIISGFSVPVKGWRWSSWELLWFIGPIFCLLFICLPETSADNILLRRARRLRKTTGNSSLKSRSEIMSKKHLSASSIVFDALIKPWEINIKDPAVLFSTLYSALTYTIFYSFFEAFPIVYMGVYGFNSGEVGLVFVAAIVGQLLFVPAYMLYLRIVKTRAVRGYQGPPEDRLIPALWACFLLPVGLLIFGRSAKQFSHL
jgi:DHA1 family multidrug resistance protein-like MFS transporter